MCAAGDPVIRPGLVGKEGLEPSILAERAPKARAYTNSATCPIINV